MVASPRTGTGPMNDRDEHIISYLLYFGASRVSDIPMFGAGGHPCEAEIKSLAGRRYITQVNSSIVPLKAYRMSRNQTYWGLTDDGYKKARQLMQDVYKGGKP